MHIYFLNFKYIYFLNFLKNAKHLPKRHQNLTKSSPIPPNPCSILQQDSATSKKLFWGETKMSRLGIFFRFYLLFQIYFRLQWLTRVIWSFWTTFQHTEMKLFIKRTRWTSSDRRDRWRRQWGPTIPSSSSRTFDVGRS